jgi:hypothetical protein
MSNVITVSLKELLAVTGYYLISQSPNVYPRKLDIILEKINDEFLKDYKSIGNYFKYKHIKDSELYDFVDKTLKDVSEFHELNLTNNEIKAGVKIGDERGNGFVFVSRYHDGPDEDNNFIDLDAVVQNVTYMLKKHHNEL